MKEKNLMKKASAILLVVAMLCTSAFAMSIDFADANIEMSTADERTIGAWTLDMDDNQSTLSTIAGVEAGSRTALVIRTGDNMGAEANTVNGEWNGSGTALGSWFDYGANGNVMVDEYDFSFTSDSNFQVRGFSGVDSSHNGTGSICHAFSIQDNKLKINADASMQEWPTVCDVTPDVIHTMRLEINNQSSPYTTKFYLDGQLVYTKEGYSDNSKAVDFLLTTPNSEARIYRFARTVAADADSVAKRNFCKTFDGMTERDFWNDYFCVENLDGWIDKGNGHTFALEVEDSDTKYMKLKRRGAGGNGHVRWDGDSGESVPKDLNIYFSYWGLGLNQIRLINSGAQTAKIDIVDNQLVWCTSTTDEYEGEVLKAFVAPYVEHCLTVSMISVNKLAIFLDGELLAVKGGFSGAVQIPTQIRFYNMNQAFNNVVWGNANRHMYAGINIKSITTDDDMANNAAELIIKKDDIPVEGVSADEASSVISAKAAFITQEEMTGILVLAKYVDGVLVDVVRGSEFTCGANGAYEIDSISLAAGAIEEGASYKLFALSGVDTIKPLTANAVVE